MLFITLVIVATLLACYLLMTWSPVIHLNRAALAMFSGVFVWAVFTLHGGVAEPGSLISTYIDRACQVILFLIATNTIIEILHNNGVFDSLQWWLRMRSSKRFLWILSLLTFIISANVDNLTTVVLMMSIMSRIVANHRQRIVYACAILLAATLGGAFTVIGDMTSLMLWVGDTVTATGYAKGLFLPCIASLAVFNLSLTPLLHGNVEVHSALHRYRGDDSLLHPWQKTTMLAIGIIGLWFIPSFRLITHFPAFLGALCLLALVWLVEGIFTFKVNGNRLFVDRKYLSNTEFIGMQIILYYLGISLGVGALTECGALQAAHAFLTQHLQNVYAYGLVVGALSSVIDNVPVVMMGMNIFPIAPATTQFCQDGTYWQLLSYCSAMGGCLLYISTLAGRALLSVEKIRLTWYLRHILWRVLIAWGIGLLIFRLTH